MSRTGTQFANPTCKEASQQIKIKQVSKLQMLTKGIRSGEPSYEIREWTIKWRGGDVTCYYFRGEALNQLKDQIRY